MRILVLAIALLIPSLALADQAACPIQLQESQTQTLVVAESRNATEQRLAVAIRANKELSDLYSKALEHVTKIEKELAALKAKDEPKKEPVK